MNPVTLFRMEVAMVIFWNSIYVKGKEFWVCIIGSYVYTYKYPWSWSLRGRSLPTSKILDTTKWTRDCLDKMPCSRDKTRSVWQRMLAQIRSIQMTV